MISYQVSKPQWNFWYALAILNSFVFFLISVLSWGMGQDGIDLSLLGSTIYFLFSMLIFLKLVISGGTLAPIAWFILGSGIFFGAGTLIWEFIGCDSFRCSMISGRGAEEMSRVNLLNASSIMIVILSASKLSFQQLGKKITRVDLRSWNWPRLQRITIPFVVSSLFLSFYFFPIPENLIIRSLLSKFELITPLFILLTGATWRELPFLRKIISLCLISGVLIIGLLSFSKTAFVIPILVLLSGIWIARRSLLWIVIPGSFLVILYVLVLAPSIGSGRLDSRYGSAKDTVSNRVEILFGTGNAALYGDERRIEYTARRFAPGPIQIYLINQYEAGKPGESLKDFWVALIPRVLWPQKPNVTRFGSELHNQFWKTRNARSALAPTYSAEAYWNFGILGVIVFSALIGLELGWLTNMWYRAIQGKDPAYLIIAFPAAYMGFNVETWIAATYFGGFMTLIVIWKSLKFIMKNKRAYTRSRLVTDNR